MTVGVAVLYILVVAVFGVVVIAVVVLFVVVEIVTGNACLCVMFVQALVLVQPTN